MEEAPMDKKMPETPGDLKKEEKKNEEKGKPRAWDVKTTDRKGPVITGREDKDLRDRDWSAVK